ncbi:MAG: hypothetical protein N3A55_00140 [Methylohalobius sp.]|nr:hypothetical protein [Methylohalobius sp.]
MQPALALSLTVLFLTGCAPAAQSPRTFVDQLELERKALSAIGEKWSRGQALVRQGEAAIQSGDRLIEQGQKQRAQGQAMIEQGRQLIEQAEREYQTRTGTGVATFPLEESEK